MRLYLMIFMVSILAFGCSTWHNPNIKDQSMSDKILAKDRKYCDQWSEGMVPIRPSNQPVPEMGDDFLDDVEVNEGEFMASERQYGSFDECMKRKGWVKK